MLEAIKKESSQWQNYYLCQGLHLFFLKMLLLKVSSILEPATICCYLWSFPFRIVTLGFKIEVQEVIPSASIFPELYDHLILSAQGPCTHHGPAPRTVHGLPHFILMRHYEMHTIVTILQKTSSVTERLSNLPKVTQLKSI